MKIDLNQHGGHRRLSNVFPNRTYKPKSHANKAGAFTDGGACEPSTGSLNALRLRMENLRQYGNKNWHRRPFEASFEVGNDDILRWIWLPHGRRSADVHDRFRGN